jgi:hypothetical protein
MSLPRICTTSQVKHFLFLLTYCWGLVLDIKRESPFNSLSVNFEGHPIRSPHLTCSRSNLQTLGPDTALGNEQLTHQFWSLTIHMHPLTSPPCVFTKNFRSPGTKKFRYLPTAHQGERTIRHISTVLNNRRIWTYGQTRHYFFTKGLFPYSIPSRADLPDLSYNQTWIEYPQQSL